MTSFPKLRRQVNVVFAAIAVILIALFIVFWITGCGDEGVNGPGCVGEVTKTYTEYKPGTGITTGSVTIPSGKTEYFIAVKTADGTFCSKRVSKNEWLAYSEGDTYGGT